MRCNETLLTIRQDLISLFKRYEYIILPILRFILSLSILRMLRQATEYEGVFSQSIALIAFSLIGTFASAESILICMLFITTIFIGSFNIILGVITFLVLGTIYILYGRLFPKESLLIIAILVAFPLKMSLLVVFVAALFGSFASSIAIIVGTAIWYTLPILIQTLPNIGMDKTEILDTVSRVLAIDYAGMMANREMLILCVISFIVFSCIYIIRKLEVDYGPYIGIGVGAVMNILGFILAKVFFNNLTINIPNIILTTLFFAAIATVLQFFAIALDYQRAEMVSFEDNENYYYVKIIPKIQSTAEKKMITHIYTDPSPRESYEDFRERERINHLLMEDEARY